jgi:phospholipase/carboxylesterase
MLRYDVIAPADATRWILVLHGLGDSKEGWKPIADELDLPDTGWIFAQAPDAYYDGWSWFDLQLPDTAPDLYTVHRSRDQLRILLSHLAQTRGITADQLFLMGFSQGCLMTMAVALTHPESFAGVIGISGWIAELESYPAAFGTAAKAQRILMTHGTQDQVIPISLTRPQATALRQLGLNLTWREYRKPHGVDPVQELPDIRAFLLARLSATPAADGPVRGG